MIKYQGQGGSIPRETTIAGQRHLLAYINPFEVDLLQQYNAAPNAMGPGGIPAYPGNAAAEGGFGLGAGDAFGGGGGSSGGSSGGSAGASAGGGSSGGGSSGDGPGEGGGFDAFGDAYGSAAEAAAADAAAEAAAAAANAEAAAAFGGGYDSPAMGGGGAGGGFSDAFGNTYGSSAAAAMADNVAEIQGQLANMGVSPNDTSAAGRGISPSMGFSMSTSDPLGRGRADVSPSSPSVSSPFSAPSAPAGLPSLSLDTAPSVSTATAQAPATPSISNDTAMAIDEAVFDVMNEDVAPNFSTSSINTNVSPAMITEDTVSTSKGTTPSSQGRLGQLASNLAKDISMGMIALGKSRADAADAMFAKGYTADEIGSYFGRTDATVAANAAAAENAVGADSDRDYLSNPCPEGYRLDPNTKVCVIDTEVFSDGGSDEESSGGSPRELAPINIPTSLPSSSSPYTQVGPGGLGMPSPLQPYPSMGGGLAAMTPPNQTGILMMAPPQMQPAFPIPNLAVPQRLNS